MLQPLGGVVRQAIKKNSVRITEQVLPAIIEIENRCYELGESESVAAWLDKKGG